MAKRLLIASWTGLGIYLALVFTSELHDVFLLHFLVAPLHAMGLFDRLVTGFHFILLVFAEGVILWAVVLPLIFVGVLRRAAACRR